MKRQHRIKHIFFFLLVIGLSVGLTAQAANNPGKQQQPDAAELTVLMYHHISPEKKKQGTYVISPEQLESDLRYLQENEYETISLEQLLHYVDGTGSLPEKPVMITFDDGQESFAGYALPLLEQYDAKAVIFIVGSYAEASTQESEHNLQYSYLDWNELEDISQSPHVELGNHTYDMHKSGRRKGCRIMWGESTEAYEKALEKDLEQTQAALEFYTGARPLAFAYPLGYRCKQSVPVLQKIGIRAAFTCEEKKNILRPGDTESLYKLGRYNRSGTCSTSHFFASIFS